MIEIIGIKPNIAIIGISFLDLPITFYTALHLILYLYLALETVRGYKMKKPYYLKDPSSRVKMWLQHVLAVFAKDCVCLIHCCSNIGSFSDCVEATVLLV